MFLGKYDSRRL